MTALATLTSAKITVTVLPGDDPEFAFDVFVDGVMFDSFSTLPAAISTAISLFKAQAY